MNEFNDSNSEHDQAERPIDEERRATVQWLVRDTLRRYTSTMVRAVNEAADVHENIVVEQIMDRAYFTSSFGKLRLMGQAEIVELLGLKSRQRLNQMRVAKTLNFPKPIAELRMGPVWLAKDIEQWAPTWRRKPGRPPKESKGESGGSKASEAER